MAFRPEEFLEFAAKIHAEPALQSPAGVRTAVSRCYYFALLTAASLLSRSGEELDRSDDVHETVARTLSRGSKGTWRELGDDLADMNDLRIAADLDAESKIGIDTLAHALAIARMFRDDLVRCLGH